jgi:DNA-binding GntR family transcriptional regulator
MPSREQPDILTRLRTAKRDNLSERIYLGLRTRLQRCEISAEARLVDLDVAALFGASRMPAREALLRLANEGYLVGTTRGFVVPRLSFDDIRDIFEIRKRLEPYAAGAAAQDLDDQGRQGLAVAIHEARNASAIGDVDRLILANIDFRRIWLGALRNERLAATLARFADQVQTIRLNTLRDLKTRTIVVAGLEDIHDAFARRDPKAASERMAAFIEAAEQAYFRVRQADTEREQALATALDGSA